MGSMCVLSCRCCVSVVHPVANLSAVSTCMLLSSHYLHDYSNFYSDLGINSLHTFV